MSRRGNYRHAPGRMSGSGRVVVAAPNIESMSPRVQRDAELIRLALRKYRGRVATAVAEGHSVEDKPTFFGVWHWLNDYARMFARKPAPCSDRVLRTLCRICKLDEPPPLPPEVVPLGLRYLPKKPPTPKPQTDIGVNHDEKESS